MLRKTPKGTLILIGGAEDKGDGLSTHRNKNYIELEILRDLLPTEKKSEKSIEIITTASTIPVEINEMYSQAFNRLGFKKIGFINMNNNVEADDPKFVKRIENAHCVVFSGGDQFRLSTILGNSSVVAAVLEKYTVDKDFIVAGTSAGAMAMSVLMLYRGQEDEAMLSRAVRFTSGFGFVDGCIIDTHFIKRGRFGRLAQSVVENPAFIGIGLGEDTALIVKKGNKTECRGSGMVVIMDGQDVGHTNIAYAKEDTPICIENMRVHILTSGNGYLLNERKFVPSKKDLKIENLSNEKIQLMAQKKRIAAANEELAGSKATKK